MQTSDLFEAAELACRAFWDGSDKSRLNLRECMTDLKIAVEAEKKRRAQSETATILSPSREHA